MNEASQTIEVPVLPVESMAFSADPDSYLLAARQVHPWLARFSQGYIVHGYQATADLLADATNLQSGFDAVIDFYGVRGTMWARFMNEIVIAVSGDKHKRLRSSVVHAFTPKRANLERDLMRRVITQLLDEWVPRGAFDFAEFASYFPVAVICGLLGVSAEKIPSIRGALENHLKSLNLDPAAKPLFLAGWDVLWDFVTELVAEREAIGSADSDSLLDTLIACKNAGDLDETELLFMVLTVIVAGYDTSRNQLTMTMKLLLDYPDLYDRCAEDHAFCLKVVEESIRHSAIATPFRMAAQDFSYDGFTFHKGDTVVLAPPLANRDPQMYPKPEEFDPLRENASRHVGFGRGAHICLGQFIARNQLQEGLHMIAGRLRNPRLTGPVEWRPFLGAWGLRSLPIAFDNVH